jgi:hypothetical protein
MNGYFIAVTSAALGFLAGFWFYSWYESHIRKPQSKLVEHISSHKAKPVKAWSPVERKCSICHATFWVSAGDESNYECGSEECYRADRNRRTMHNTDRHP